MILPLTKGPIELALAMMEQGHYPPLVENRLKAIGLTELPAKMSLPRDAVLAEYIQVRRQHETHTQDEAIARAVARVAWRIHAAPKARPEIVRRIDRDRKLLWAWRVAILLGVLGILGLLLTGPAKAQIDVIKFKDSGGATLKTFGAPFTIQCSTNITCTATGSTMAISASSTASTAWSSLSAGLNSNLGTFSVSGNTWDFSGSTLFKLRVGASCTTSANGDSCHDATTGRWHFWVNGADRFMVGLTNVGASGQVPISNADGTATFADPIVSPNQDVASTAAWTSVTALNTAVSVAVSQRSTVTVSFNGSSITGGAVTFEVSPDNTNWYAKAGVRGDATALETTYTLLGANQSWTFAVGGYTNFRVRLSTVITGAGTANINVIPQALGSPNLAAVLAQITAALPTGANTIGGVNLAQYTPVAGRLPVDGSGVTQPVSGTVTANAGTGNFNVVGSASDNSANSTAKLPVIPARANAAAPTWTEGNQVPLSVDLSGNARTSVVTALPAGANVIGALTANQSVNVAQIAGTNTVTAAAGVQRVGIAGNANAAMDFAGQNAASPANSILVGCQFNTTPTAITSGNSSPEQCNNLGHRLVTLDAETTKVIGTTRITGVIGGALDAANNAAAPANVLVTGVETITAVGSNPTSATSGNVRRAVSDLQGNVFVRPGGPNTFSCFVEAVTVTTQCVAAPAAGLRAYVMSIAVSNEAATVQTVDVVFGTGVNCATGTTALTHKFQMGTNATTTSPFSIDFTFVSPLVPTAANAICVRPSAATAFGATITGFIAP